MRNFLTSVAILGSVAIAPAALAALDVPGGDPDSFSVYVELRPGHTLEVGNRIDRVSAFLGKELRVAAYSTQDNLQAALGTLRADPDVVSVTPTTTVTAQFTPNDPDYGQQWYLKTINWDPANNTENGRPPVISAVIDSAYDCTIHPDLAPNCRLDLSVDYLPMDQTYNVHGFHVDSIIAASTNNAMYGAGIAGTAQIVNLRFINQNGSGDSGAATQAVDYLIGLAQRGYRIISNNSWGSTGTDNVLRAAFAAAKAAGINNVYAAGNGGTDACTIIPASYTESGLAIGATDQNNNTPSWTNTGRCVALFAPGVDIYGADNAQGTLSQSGTSESAPMVTGAEVLVASMNPGMTPDQVEMAILQSPYAGLPSKSGELLSLPSVLGPSQPGFRLSTQCPVPPNAAQDTEFPCQTYMIPVGGFAGSVSLDCNSDGSVPNASCNVSPSLIGPGDTANVTLTPSDGTPAFQGYVLTVHGASGGVQDDISQPYEAVWPRGSQKFGPYSSSSAPQTLGRQLCPGSRTKNCPVLSASITIPVGDHITAWTLKGSVNITYKGAVDVILTDPSGNVYTVLSDQLVAALGENVAFSLGSLAAPVSTPAGGNWTVTATIPQPTTVITGQLVSATMEIFGAN